MIWFQPFSETHDIVCLEPDSLVKFDHSSILATHLEVDLWAACCSKTTLGFVHHEFAYPGVLMSRMNSKVVDPAAVAIVSGHNGGNDLAV